MKLAVQIALGIFLAGVLSFGFWMTFIVAGVATVAHSLPHVTPITVYEPRVQRAATEEPEQTTLHITGKNDCTNFVQMQNGEKHCLVPQHHERSTAR